MSKISIILPIYNSEKYLKRSIECCINQSLKDIEIIFVDDKGQDNSIEIIKDYMQKDSRIKLVDNITNQGIFRAKRTGALNASGKYLMFLDPDDELELDACEILYNEIEKHNVDFVYFNGYEIKNDVILKELSRNLLNLYNICINDFKSYFVKNKLQWVLWLKIYKKAIYLKALDCIDDIDDKFKTNLTEDVLVFYHVLNLSSNVTIVNKYFYNYYIYEHSISNDLNDNNFYNCMRDYYDVFELIKKSCLKNNFNFRFTNQYLNRLKREQLGMQIKYIKNKNTFKNIIKLAILKLNRKRHKLILKRYF